MRVFIGMETSGALRRRFMHLGHDVFSCDMLPAEDGGDADHIIGDVFAALDDLWAIGWWQELAIFHPTCTYLTNSAAWAFADPDFERYPGVGYHQRVQPGTLTGAARREARERALDDVRRILDLPYPKAIENPATSFISKAIRRPDQVIQPYDFGDDASKSTGLWLDRLPPLVIDPASRCPGRVVSRNGKLVERWANQTDSGQNRITPSADRWLERSATFPGIAKAFAQWGGAGLVQMMEAAE